MWSTFNAEGLRRKWMTRRTDPGRSARAAVIKPSSSGENGGPSALKVVELRFMAREVVIECHHADCP